MHCGHPAFYNIIECTQLKNIDSGWCARNTAHRGAVKPYIVKPYSACPLSIHTVLTTAVAVARTLVVVCTRRRSRRRRGSRALLSGSAVRHDWSYGGGLAEFARGGGCARGRAASNLLPGIRPLYALQRDRWLHFHVDRWRAPRRFLRHRTGGPPFAASVDCGTPHRRFGLRDPGDPRFAISTRPFHPAKRPLCACQH